MDFAILQPEINSGRMYAGPGAGPMLAAAAAWDALATELHAAATTYGAVISGLTAGPWLGPAAAAMAAAAGPYVAWMRTTATQAEQTATQAKAAAGKIRAAIGGKHQHQRENHPLRSTGQIEAQPHQGEPGRKQCKQARQSGR